MIKDKSVPVTYSNNKSYYLALGYPDLKRGSTIQVKIEDLPSNCNKEVNCECDFCKKNFMRSYQLVRRSYDKIGLILCYQCSRKRIGKTMNRKNIDEATRKRTGSKHPRFNTNKDSLKEYAYKVRETTKKQPLFLLENGDKPITRCGVSGGFQLDHMMSIKDGFENGIPPEFIGSIVNLQIIPWEENRKKGSKSICFIDVNNFVLPVQKHDREINKKDCYNQ